MVNPLRQMHSGQNTGTDLSVWSIICPSILYAVARSNWKLQHRVGLSFKNVTVIEMELNGTLSHFLRKM